MRGHVFQLPLAEPGIRAHMHRLGVGHKSSCKPVYGGDIGIPGPRGILPALYGPRYRQRDTPDCHAVMPARRFG
jgi:hypothetical protein